MTSDTCPKAGAVIDDVSGDRPECLLLDADVGGDKERLRQRVPENASSKAVASDTSEPHSKLGCRDGLKSKVAPLGSGNVHACLRPFT